MKNIIKLITVISVLLLCMLSLASCDAHLPSPENFELNEQTLDLKWDKVKGAMSYVISISGDEREKNTRMNQISLDYLDAGTYEIKVKAIGDGVEFEDSDWGTYTFVRAKESGLKFQLINSNSEYEVVGAGSASGDVVIENYYRGKPVTSIADKALYNNSKITSIVIDKDSKISRIGDKAFSKCTSLQSVSIENDLAYIGEYAFQSSKMLETVKLPDTVTAISPYMFSWCSVLKEVTIGPNITSIGAYSFSNCLAITSIALPDTVTSIDEYAFSNCEALTTITIGNSVKNIGKFAFSSCFALESITFPETLKSIDDYAFTRCEKIQSITIPDSVETIGYEAFSECTAASTVKLGTGLKKIGSGAFYNTAFYKNAPDLIMLDGWVIEQKNKLAPVTPSTVFTENNIYGIADSAYAACTHEDFDQISLHGIKYVGDYAFYGCSALWDVRFDDSLLTIGVSSFARCEFLQWLELGNSLQSIGMEAFFKCNLLAEATLPDSLTKVGRNAFHSTMAHNTATDSTGGVVYIGNWLVGASVSPSQPIMGLAIREGTRGIADYAFRSAIIWGTVEMPDTVEYIGRSAFYGGTVITGVKLSASLKYIDDYAFYGCQNALFVNTMVDPVLGATVLPEGLTYIGRSAFYGCVGIAKITIPGTVKTIGDYAFYQCVSLGLPGFDEDNPITGGVFLSEGLEHIGNRAFQYCTALTNITIPNSVTYLGTHAFYKCAALKDVTLGTSLENVLEYTFFNCEALENVNLGNVKSVGKYAFRNCALITSIDLSNLESIGYSSFYKCASLTKLNLSDSLKNIGDYAFRGCNLIGTVIIPDSVETVGKHAFYGMANTTIFCEVAEAPIGWHFRFNSSYRPIFWGCELSDDNTYVVSFTKSDNNPDNVDENNIISDPEREGYTFEGWSTILNSTSVTYTTDTVATAPAGTVLYAVWTAITE